MSDRDQKEIPLSSNSTTVTNSLAELLGSAASAGDVQMIQKLMQAKADVNIPDQYGLPLFRAIACVQPEAVQVLLDENAAVNSIDSDYDQTPLQGAIARAGHREGMAKVVKLLIDAKADLEVGALKGETPLYNAVRHNQIQMASILLLAKADTQVQDDKGVSIQKYVEDGDHMGMKWLFRKFKDREANKAILAGLLPRLGKQSLFKNVPPHKAGGIFDIQTLRLPFQLTATAQPINGLRNLTEHQLAGMDKGLTFEQVAHPWFQEGHVLAAKNHRPYEEYEGLTNEQALRVADGLSREKAIEASDLEAPATVMAR